MDGEQMKQVRHLKVTFSTCEGLINPDEYEPGVHIVKQKEGFNWLLIKPPEGFADCTTLGASGRLSKFLWDISEDSL